MYKNLIIIFFIPYFCFCFEQQFSYLGVPDIQSSCEYLSDYLTQEEKTDWYCAETQKELKQAFLTIFYKLKEFVRSEILKFEELELKNVIDNKTILNYHHNLKSLKNAFGDLELLANEMIDENSEFDKKVSEALKEIQEVKQTALTGKRIKFPKFTIVWDQKLHVPPLLLVHKWNMCISTIELQQVYYSMVFSIEVAMNMKFLDDVFFIKVVEWLDDFREKTKIRHPKAEELYLSIWKRAQGINRKLLYEKFDALEVSDPENL